MKRARFIKAPPGEDFSAPLLEPFDLQVQQPNLWITLYKRQPHTCFCLPINYVQNEENEAQMWKRVQQKSMTTTLRST